MAEVSSKIDGGKAAKVEEPEVKAPPKARVKKAAAPEVQRSLVIASHKERYGR